MQYLQKYKPLFDYLFAYWVYGLMLIGIHEFFHSNIARILGYKNIVIYYWLSGYTIIQNIIPNPLHLGLIAISGGMLTALLYVSMLYFLDWETDYPEICSIKTHVYQQFTYSFFETYYIFGYLSFDNLVLIYNIVGTIIFTIMTILFIKHYFEVEKDC